jgi:hypothetical protein
MTCITISRKAVDALKRGLRHKGYHDPEIDGFTYLGRVGYYKKWTWSNKNETINVSCTPRNHWVEVHVQHFEGSVSFVKDEGNRVWIGCNSYRVLIDLAESFEEASA